MVALLGCTQAFPNDRCSPGRVFAEHSNWAHASAGRGIDVGTLDRGGCDDLRRHVRVLQPRVVHVGGLGR